MKEIKLEIQGKEYSVIIEEFGATEAVIKVNDKTYKVGLKDLGEEIVADTVIPVQTQVSSGGSSSHAPTQSAPATSAPASTGGSGEVLAPLPGLILNVMVKIGDKVTAGQRIMVMEAMKMENDINASKDGTIKTLNVKNGDNISEGDVLASIE